jgi:hypothetical protein
LRHSAHADRHYDNRAQERRGEQRHGHRNVSARPEELNAHVTSVLSDEVNERNSKDDRNDNRHPRRRRSRVAKSFIVTMRRFWVLSWLPFLWGLA